MQSRVSSSFNALKELFAIVAAVAIANVSVTASQFANGGPAQLRGDHVNGFDHPGRLWMMTVAWCVVLLCVRFYHGNFRLIDDELADNERSDSVVLGDASAESAGIGSDLMARLLGNRFFRALEFATVVMQGALLTGLGQAVQNANTLFYALLVLFLSDVILAALGFMAIGTLSRPRCVWLVVNVVSVILLCGQFVFFLPFAKLISLTLIAGFAVDYVGNWSFYFPRDAEA